MEAIKQVKIGGTLKSKEKYLNELFKDAYSEEEAVEAFIYLTNKNRFGGTTTEARIRQCAVNGTLGTMLRRLDFTAFQSSY